MYRLSSIIGILGLAFGLSAQSPHGEDFKINCAACHNADGWEIPASAWSFEGYVADLPQDSVRFNHNEDTAFPLEGGHAATDCRLCHETLSFAATPTECIDCHTDIHAQTVGSDCVRCHSVDNWLVDNITEIHQDNGFPLMGVHAQITCNDCHTSETNLQFHRLGNECLNCHLADYMATTEPNHAASSYSTNCIDCHDVNGFDWSADNILHDFFPLEKGHNIGCMECHTTGVFEAIPSDCISCHEQDFLEANNPDHQVLNFGTDCAACHTLDLDWMPAQFRDHDAQYFPIYSGEHAGEWSDCVECHPNPADYSVFTCTTCHGKSETDDDHNGVNGYVYESTACLACHPTGSEDDSFDHSKTNFPLNGAHTAVDCNDCHTNGFAGTPTDCFACHETDFNNAEDPDHLAAGFPMDCAQCHTENAWEPANWDHDGEYFPIYSGNHQNEWNDCVDCHITPGDYSIFSCIDCHEHNDPAELANDHEDEPDYQFVSTACLECHPQGD